MVISAYKSKRLIDHLGTTALVIGFRGQLKNWWENFLSPKDRNRILTHTIHATDDQGCEFQEEATSALLIHAITLHFLGNPKEEQAAAKTILINL